jgi:hypothetical protein
MAITLPANLVMALQALQDGSNLNIIPKSTTQWFIETVTGMKNN